MLSNDDDKAFHTKPASFGSVSFQADTDDSKNFPSDKHFLVFKKQRDMFYEVRDSSVPTYTTVWQVSQ